MRGGFAVPFGGFRVILRNVRPVHIGPAEHVLSLHIPAFGALLKRRKVSLICFPTSYRPCGRLGL